MAKYAQQTFEKQKLRSYFWIDFGIKKESEEGLSCVGDLLEVKRFFYTNGGMMVWIWCTTGWIRLRTMFGNSPKIINDPARMKIGTSIRFDSLTAVSSLDVFPYIT